MAECSVESMVGGTTPPQSDSGEISRVLVLNLSGKKRGARAPPRRSLPLTTPSLLSRGTPCTSSFLLREILLHRLMTVFLTTTWRGRQRRVPAVEPRHQFARQDPGSAILPQCGNLFIFPHGRKHRALPRSSSAFGAARPARGAGRRHDWSWV